MSAPSSEPSRILVDVSGSASSREAALAAVAEHSFKHRHLFRLLGDTTEIARGLSVFPYEAEYVETRQCDSPDEALRHAMGRILDHADTLFVSAQETRLVSAAAAESECLLPGVPVPALAAIVPTVSDDPVVQTRYSVLVDVEGQPWPEPIPGEVLIALARPLVAWFHHRTKLRVGALTLGGGVPPTSADERLLHALHGLTPPLVNAGALSPTDVMSGSADLVLCRDELGAMFVRTLEATFVAAESLVRRETQGVRGRIGVRVFRDRLEKLRDYGQVDSYGGNPLLGVRGPTVILRPDASTRAWMNAIRTAEKIRKEQLIAQQRLLLHQLGATRA